MTSNRRSLIVLVLGFTLLGMPGATLGVAWPSMADDLARSLGDLGVLTIVTGSAYSVMSLASGNLSRRFSAGRMLVAAAVAAAVALASYSIADAWWLLIVASVPLGASGGVIDAIGNSFVAVRRGPRSMGAIHAAFGFGSMVAPLAMTGLIAIGAPWRVGFAILAGAEVILAIGYLTIAAVIRMPMEGRSERPRRFGRWIAQPQAGHLSRYAGSCDEGHPQAKHRGPQDFVTRMSPTSATRQSIVGWKSLHFFAMSRQAM